MTEKQVKEHLDFLCEEYGLHYTYEEFKGFYGGNNSLYTYNFYNKRGCFTIKNYPVIGDIDYIYLDSFHTLKDYLFSDYTGEKLSHVIHIYEYEPEIWKKHRKKGFLKIPFFWNSDKQLLKALAEVIKAQIEKHGEFFGIKIK